jgi:putative ABC transport system permease protein
VPCANRFTGGVSDGVVQVGPALAAAGVLLVVIAVAASLVGRLGHGRSVARAAARATVQLGVVSLAIAAIVSSLLWTAVFLVAMFVVATVTSGGRMRAGRRGAWAAVPIAAGALPVFALLLAVRVVDLRGIVLIPVGGILLGGAMTATTLAGGRALDELTSRRGEVEAALALGFLPRDALKEVCRPAAAQALVPVLDQTRTVGLVTLPGAFVGMLLGGASPVEAGAVQLLVLVALLAAEAVAIAVAVEVIASELIRR